ncbi:uncharacterized protein [Macrobrachium rosenbergii]|uniref:uncharacterized protein n=1 Tax=Macrobrachium rosenbergii TaxID=79674 RepID=UPI0034D74D50
MINKLLLFCFFITFESGTKTNITVVQRNRERRALSHILNQLVTGPLRGRAVTLILDETAEGPSSEGDDLIRNANEPIYLLRLPLEMPDGLFRLTNNSGGKPHSTNDLIREFPLRQKVQYLQQPRLRRTTRDLRDSIFPLNRNNTPSTESYRLVRAKDNDWGTVFTNGTWTGSLGLLNRGEVVMSVAPYSVSLQRLAAVDFSEPIYMDELTVAYHKHQLQSDMAAFIKPYTFKMWMCILGSLLIITLTMIFLRLFHHSAKTKTKSNEKIIRFSPIVWPLCCLIDQASIWEPRDDPSRVAGGLWVLMAFIISCIYKSTLFAMIITPKVQLPFNSFEELARTDIVVGAPTGSRFQEVVENASKGSKLGGIKKNMMYSSNSTDGTAGFLRGKWALATVRRTLLYHLQEDFTAQHVANATYCLQSVGSGFTDVARPLALYNFYGVFSVYLGGMLAVDDLSPI